MSYADDFVVTGASKALLEQQVRPIVERFLGERGLQLSESKTQVTNIEDGFDFLGQNIRKYANGKLLIKPSSKSQKAFRSKVSDILSRLRTAPRAVVHHPWRSNERHHPCACPVTMAHARALKQRTRQRPDDDAEHRGEPLGPRREQHAERPGERQHPLAIRCLG